MAFTFIDSMVFGFTTRCPSLRLPLAWRCRGTAPDTIEFSGSLRSQVQDSKTRPLFGDPIWAHERIIITLSDLTLAVK